ncbi:MAG: LemA family protein [Magnetococcales bacterium]|nr:LemA family protein [Magnetococcales bacterium]MBF0148815.1 LemA family protein [Magnetococcales bacterium]MBF0173415.1 LemA family protein [Magnetococcales bacterium]MBF0346459.1 LemA family protein [Magnetococcales bacterium]MBF0629850.1 LemA family protein [Magnetococcales bacterium]
MNPAAATITWYIPVSALLVAIFYSITLFNRLVRLDNERKNAFSQISVQLKRRHDLIPNLVETAKGYLRHERQTLEAVINARNHADTARKTADRSPTPEAMGALMGAEQRLGGVLGNLFAVVEQYPEIKADQTMARLHEELTSTENRIAFARQAFNDAVMVYNTRRASFPDTLVARMAGFQEAMPWDDLTAEERAAVQVTF